MQQENQTISHHRFFPPHQLIGWFIVGWFLCLPWQAHANTPEQCDKPDILLIVDLSGSMTGGISDTQSSPTKLQLMRKAYTEILQKFQKGARFGLITIRSQSGPRNNHQFNCSTCTGCYFCAGESPLVELQVSLSDSDSGQKTINALNRAQAFGCTPTYPAMELAINHYKKQIIPKDKGKKRKRFVILMTDGVPNIGCPNGSFNCSNGDHSRCGDHLAKAAKTLRSVSVSGVKHDIQTFVIGFGKVTPPATHNICGNCNATLYNIDARLLNKIAKAGGTKSYFQADDLTQLRNALDQTITSATGQTEECDGKDNNCDGNIDENLTRPCKGFCATGTQQCEKGEWSACTAADEPRPEICNNVDDDCDGEVDNGLQQPCTADCGKGIKICTKGKWSKCQHDPTQDIEVCNGKDDDCDGKADQDLTRPCETNCGKGTQRCIEGDWSTCSAPRPHTEACDGIDNDCNGKIDDDTSCNGKCIDGLCHAKCTQECPAGFLCGDDKYCHPKPCQQSCPTGTVCKLGHCVNVDCSAPDSYCLPNEICQQKRCTKDPCHGISCASDRFCYQGTCVLSCSAITCPAGKTCQRGQCIDDPCQGVICYEKDQVCRKGKCVAYSCQTQADCQSGDVCQEGRCVDPVCRSIQCPESQLCIDGSCYADNDDVKPPPYIPPSNGFQSDFEGKGCGCQSHSQLPPASALLLVLLGLILVRRQRA